MKQKGSIGVILIFAVLLTLVGAGAYYFGTKKIWKTADTTVQQQPAQALPVISNETIKSKPQVGPGSMLYESEKLGIRFLYAKEIEAGRGTQALKVQERANKVYIYFEGDTPEMGQWVEVFDKNANQSLEQAVKEHFLKGYSETDCFVEKLEGEYKSLNPNINQKVIISYPSDSEMSDPSFYNAEKCPPIYSAANGITYFADFISKQDKFVFFSIGQYAIVADADKPQGKTWQETVEFFK